MDKTGQLRTSWCNAIGFFKDFNHPVVSYTPTFFLTYDF